MMSIRNPYRSLHRPIAVGVLLLLTSCAGGGGSSGTGITTAQGTIAGSETARFPLSKKRGGFALARILELIGAPRVANAVTGVEGIRVAIEGTGLSTESDASGFFSLAGGFGGPVTLVFDHGEGPPARLDVDIPTGGTLTLDRVRFEGFGGPPRPDAQRLEFEGVVAAKNCAGGALAMVSSVTPADGNSYPVDVGGAALRDSDGNPISCDDITGGDVLSVQGDVRDDGGIDCREADRRPPPDGGHGPGGGPR